MTLELEHGVDEDIIDAGVAGASAADLDALRALQSTFLASRFAPEHGVPALVEVPIEYRLGEIAVRGKLDAVYTRPAADGAAAIEIVDWKTGRVPTLPEDREMRLLQLMHYVHAYAEAFGVDTRSIAATLYYVAEDVELRLDRLLDRAELERRYAAADARAKAAIAAHRP